MTPQSWVGKTIGGRYQVEALLGQGGMSAVYRAMDPNLRRVVAVKLIHAHLSTDPNFIGRFKEEAAAVARLRHPNIVQVHDFNVDGDDYYMVMEYLTGETLQARLRRLNATGRSMPLDEAIRICAQICEAAGYAHNHELVHRDIKPANIMLDVHGQAILMDFGIVKIIGGDYHTATGATVGTAMYMSPEQIRSERVDDRSDIYALGVTLYEMLRGHPPYQADSALTLMMMVLNDPLPDLQQVRAGIPDELARIVYKALAKEPKERFQSMAEMRTALLQVLGRIENLPPAETVADEPQTKPDQPTDSPTSGAPTVRDVMPDVTERRPSTTTLPPATEIDTNVPERVTVTTPAGEQAKIASVPTPKPIQPVIPPKKNVAGVGILRILFTSAGILVLLAVIVAGVLYLGGNQPPKVVLTTVAKPPLPLNDRTATGIVSLGMWEVDSVVVDLTFSPNGTLLGTANSRDWARYSQYRFYGALWQVDSASQGAILRQAQTVTSIAFSPDGQYVATGADDGSLNLWQVQGGSLVRNFEAAIGGITSVSFSSNQKLLAASSWDGIVGLWQLDNGNLLRTLREDEDGILDIDFSPDGSILAGCSYDNSILIWNVRDGSLVQRLNEHSAPVVEVTFSPDGSLLASASEDHSVGLWRVSDGKLMRTLQGHTDNVKDVSFSPDGSLLASGSDDGSVSLWKVNSGHLISKLAEQDSVLSIAFSPDGSYLVAGVANKVLHFWGTSEAIPMNPTPPPASP